VYIPAYDDPNSAEFLEFAEVVAAAVSVTFAVKNIAGSL
jgi:hypothetical protein